MHPQLTIGDFEFLGIAGRGGMGVVWRARHRGDHLPVAIKVLRPGELDEAMLHREVEATAALHHPGIIALYDYGRLGEHSGSLEGLVPGAPFLAMEYLRGGSLREQGGTLQWTGVRAVLLDVLDALAHAHARGVIHRDLKPANVLRDDHGEWRLVDFGISRATAVPGRVMGTPRYMPPEQLRGDEALIGPHTDMYAVGVLAWTLIMGESPRTGGPDEILAQALSGNLPPFAPRFDVPAALEDWLHLALEPDPLDRFAYAADARHALATMPIPLATRAPTTDQGPFDASSTFTMEIADSLQPLPAAPVFEASAHHFEAPPCPPDWSRSSRSAPQPSNLGLGLFGVRPIPLAGRSRELDRAWSMLRDVHGSGESRTLLFRGPSGIGKSRLGTWLTHRAYELGAARVWAPDPDEPEAIRALLRRELLPAASHLPRVHTALAELAHDTQTEEIASWLVGEGTRPHRDTRVGLATRQLGQQADRPLLIWVDDAPRQPDATAVALRLARSAIRPSLVVLSCREGLPADLTDAEVDAIVDLKGLEDPDIRKLLRHSLQLEQSLVSELAHRSRGYPRYIVQALTGWVQSGALTAGEGGYALRGGTWRQDSRGLENERLDGWLGESPHAECIELAAVCGPSPSHSEWRDACAGLGIETDERLAAQGLKLGLLRRRDDAWAFASASLHQAVLDRIPSERRRQMHRACAGVLNATAVPRAVAQHYLHAGDEAAAAPHLRRACMDANKEGDHTLARSLFHDACQLYQRLGERENAGDMLGWEAWMHYQLGDMHTAKRLANETMAIGSALGSDNLLASGVYTKGVIEAARGTRAARSLLETAAKTFARAGDPGMAIQAEMSAFLAGPIDQATLDGLAQHLTVAKSTFLRAMILRNQAIGLLRLGRHDEALDPAKRALVLFGEAGVRQGIAATLLDLGNVHTAAGRYDEAFECYTQAAREYVDDTGMRALAAELSIALVHLLRRRFAEGARRLRRVQRGLDAQEWVEPAMVALFGLLAVDAWDGEAEFFDLRLIEALAVFDGFAPESEHPLHPYLDIAAELWEERGDAARAARSREASAHVAKDLHRSHGD